MIGQNELNYSTIRCLLTNNNAGNQQKDKQHQKEQNRWRTGQCYFFVSIHYLWKSNGHIILDRNIWMSFTEQKFMFTYLKMLTFNNYNMLNNIFYKFLILGVLSTKSYHDHDINIYILFLNCQAWCEVTEIFTNNFWNLASGGLEISQVKVSVLLLVSRSSMMQGNRFSSRKPHTSISVNFMFSLSVFFWNENRIKKADHRSIHAKYICVRP